MLAHLHDNRVEHIVDWKTNKLQNMSRNIYDLPPTFPFFFSFSYAENLSVQSTPKSYK